MNWRMLFFSRDEKLIADMPVTEAQAGALLADAGIPKEEAIGPCFPVHGWLEATDTPDPLAEAERKVIDDAIKWSVGAITSVRLCSTTDALIRLRAAQASQGNGK